MIDSLYSRDTLDTTVTALTDIVISISLSEATAYRGNTYYTPEHINIDIFFNTQKFTLDLNSPQRYMQVDVYYDKYPNFEQKEIVLKGGKKKNQLKKLVLEKEKTLNYFNKLVK